MCGTGKKLINAGCGGIIPQALTGFPSEETSIDKDEYGFFEDVDAETDSAMLSCPSSPFHAEYSSKCGTPIARSSRSESLLLRSDDSLSVICEVDDALAPISCRYFSSGESVFICIEGFRIVEDVATPSMEVAEYKVKMSINDVSVSVWRRLTDFRQLARVSAEYATSSHQMSKSMKAWRRVEKNHPCHITDQISSLIVTETTLLKVFVKHLLYETEYLEVLVDFMRD